MTTLQTILLQQQPSANEPLIMVRESKNRKWYLRFNPIRYKKYQKIHCSVVACGFHTNPFLYWDSSISYKAIRDYIKRIISLNCFIIRPILLKNSNFWYNRLSLKIIKIKLKKWFKTYYFRNLWFYRNILKLI